MLPPSLLFFFFFNDTATTEIYTLSLHDALPISFTAGWRFAPSNCMRNAVSCPALRALRMARREDRKSTRLNSSHGYISYAVFCLKKKNGSLARLTTGMSARPRVLCLERCSDNDC